jgi:hypothetical protein
MVTIAMVVTIELYSTPELYRGDEGIGERGRRCINRQRLGLL